MQQIGANKKLQAYEIPKDIILEPKEWSAQSGELTVSMKLSRIHLTLKYKEQLSILYELNGGSTLLDSSSTKKAAQETVRKNQNPFDDVFCAILKKTELSESDLDRKLPEFGLDSTSVMQLFQLVKSRKDLIAPNVEVLFSLPLRELKDIMTGVKKMQKEEIIDWQKECTLDFEIPQSKAYAFGKRVLITGVTGFLGSFLLELFLKNGYEVHSIVRNGGVERLVQSASFFALDLNVQEFVQSGKLQIYHG